MQQYGINMIEVKKLHSHPKNPRKNIGDVTELAESIKANGIMQNLTVVPFVSNITGEKCEGEYIVVIGHRRMAAAELAGMEKLPCIIKEMTESEQLATMLAENIQRSELTPIEQAEGVQMMLDIGETVADISLKTGFSESTVRRRMKLLEMDRDTLKKTENRGATLADYEKLNEIEDIKARNRCLENIGTNNFAMELKSALDAQNKERNRQRIFAELDKFAKKVTSYPQGYSYERAYEFYDNEKVKVPENAEEGEYVYYPSSYNVTLYKKMNNITKKETKEEKARWEAKKREEERVDAVAELAKRAYELRKAFVTALYPTTKHRDRIMRFLWDMACFCGEGVYKRNLDKMLGTKLGEGATYEEAGTIAEDCFETNPERAMLITAYLMSGDNEKRYIWSWKGEWEESEGTDKLYECLERFGYVMSDEEKKLQDGSHELFKKEG